MTIPAGQVGNELPIQVVSESWFSAELQAVVMSKHSDPRMGETAIVLRESIAANNRARFSKFLPTTRLKKAARSFSAFGSANLSPATKQGLAPLISRRVRCAFSTHQIICRRWCVKMRDAAYKLRVILLGIYSKENEDKILVTELITG